MIKRLKLSVSHVISNFSLKLSPVKPCVFSTRGHRHNRLPQSLRGIFVMQCFFPKVGATQCLQFAKKKLYTIFYRKFRNWSSKKERNAPRLLVHKEVCILENNFLGLFSNAIYFSGVIAYFKSRSATLIIEKF